MSLFASLTTSVSGLNAQQEAIGNISDNIANSQTVGFKRIDTAFESLVTESTSKLNEPGGVVANPVYANDITGNLVQSQSVTSLAVTGSGFFAVKQGTTTVAGATTFGNQDLYTRRGDFTLDKNGYLVNGAGYFLEGYSVTPQTKVVNTAAVAPIQISQLLDNPVGTSQMALAANLPASSGIVGSVGYVTPSPIQETIYDALGQTHTVSMQFNKTVAAPPTWTVDISAAGSVPATDEPYQLTLTFGNTPATAGTLVSITDSTNAAPTAPATAPGTAPVVAAIASGNPATTTLSFDFGSGAQAIDFNLGTYNQAVGVTQFAGTTVQTTSVTQNGIPRGSFQNLSIDASGFVTLNYDNGQSLTYFQVPVTQFYDADQLQRLSGGAFQQTPLSGSPRTSPAGTNGAGTVSSSTLESSNVDIADQFTKLITAQQAYSANSKVITTADTLLTQVINLIHG
jgi:flagellar hook protein FlgE